MLVTGRQNDAVLKRRYAKEKIAPQMHFKERQGRDGESRLSCVWPYSALMVKNDQTDVRSTPDTCTNVLLPLHLQPQGCAVFLPILSLTISRAQP